MFFSFTSIDKTGREMFTKTEPRVKMQVLGTGYEVLGKKAVRRLPHCVRNDKFATESVESKDKIQLQAKS